MKVSKNVIFEQQFYCDDASSYQWEMLELNIDFSFSKQPPLFANVFQRKKGENSPVEINKNFPIIRVAFTYNVLVLLDMKFYLFFLSKIKIAK